MQAARASAPREVADEVRILEKRKRDKAVREEQNLKTRAAKAREKQAALWQIERWKDGKMISTEQVMEMEEPEDEEGDWDEDEPARKLRQGSQLLTAALYRSFAPCHMKIGPKIFGAALHTAASRAHAVQAQCSR